MLGISSLGFVKSVLCFGVEGIESFASGAALSWDVPTGEPAATFRVDICSRRIHFVYHCVRVLFVIVKSSWTYNFDEKVPSM